MERKPFAIVIFDGGRREYANLIDAINLSDKMRLDGIPHKLYARDVHGEMVQVGTMWEPDCVDMQQDTYGGIVANQWAPIEEHYD